jgi:PBSX family phage portal protein
MSDSSRRTRSTEDRPLGHKIALRATGEELPAVRTLKEYVQQQQLSDPFQGAYGVERASWMSLQQPPYSFYALMKMPQDNSVLAQCIDAMVTNIDGHGYRLEYTGEEGKDDSKEALAEKEMLENLLDFPNDDYTLQELRDRVRRDFETIGNAYIEIGRDANGRVVMLSHLPAHTVRMTNKETDAVEVRVKLPRDGKVTEHKISKRFRRFVQMVGTRKVYFKEFGDPRMVDPDDGQVKVTKKGKKLRMEETATEVIHLCTYNPNSPYGMPRWFNQITSVLGTRQAEMVNLDFFRDNAIPAMVLMVAGGAVTQTSLDSIGDHFNSIRGRAAMNRVLVVEATGDSAAADDGGKVPPPKMELKPLHGERQTDATFQAYDKAGMDKIRSAFRLPPLFIGRSEEMTYATAKTAYDVAEGQVFAPERQKFDDMINLRVLSTYEPKYWAFRSNPPRLSDKGELIDALARFDDVGALTPNITIGIANELFDLEIERVKEDWGDYPFELVKTAHNKGELVIEALRNAEPEEPPPGEGGPEAAPEEEPTHATFDGEDGPGIPLELPYATGDTETTKEDVARVVTRGMLALGEELAKLRDEG